MSVPARPRTYGLSDGGKVLPPNYDRAVRGLTDGELEDEILGRRGEPDYQLALLAEAERRAQSVP